MFSSLNRCNKLILLFPRPLLMNDNLVVWWQPCCMVTTLLYGDNLSFRPASFVLHCLFQLSKNQFIYICVDDCYINYIENYVRNWNINLHRFNICGMHIIYKTIHLSFWYLKMLLVNYNFYIYKCKFISTECILF